MVPLVILLLLLAPATPLTLFFFEGLIKCGWNVPFTYQIHVQEVDLLSSKDISRMSFVTAPSSPSHYNITGLDGYDADNQFDITFLIYHNCHTSGKHFLWYEEIGNFLVYSGTHYHYRDIDITQKGVPYDW